MYAGDSFFILPVAGQVGLAILSALLAVAAAICVLAFKKPVWRIIAALAVFWDFLWLTPQIYYMFYQMIYDGLPWQIIIGAPPSLDEMLDRFLFLGPATLSNHAKSVLGWALLALVPLDLVGKKLTK